MLRVYLLGLILLTTMVACSTSPSPVKPPETLTPVKNAFRITKLWNSDLGVGASDNYLHLNPVLDKEILYSSHYDGTVSAYDTRTGDTRWVYQTKDKLGSGITLYDSVLYFGTSEGNVIALDAATGTQRWIASVSSEVLANPAVTNGYVVVRCVNGEIHTLNSNDGSQLWSNTQVTPTLTLRGTSAPLIYNDIVLSAYDNGKLIAFNLQTGNIYWQTDIATARGRSLIERLVDIDSEPVIVDGVIYTVAFQGKIAAVQIGSGQIIWSREIGSYIGMSVDAYRIYLADSESRLWALDRNTGATLWKQDALLRRSVSKPILQTDYVIVGDFNGFLHWLRRDNGKLVARARLNSSDFTDPSLDETEDLLYPKSADILTSPILNGNVLIAMDRHGNTEAYEISYP